jgi:hypothetical protein
VRVVIGITALLVLGAVIGMAVVRGQVNSAVPLRVDTARPQRFVPVPLDGRSGLPWSGFFALDTETGVLCRTSNFVLEGESGWMALPTCEGLYAAVQK